MILADEHFLERRHVVDIMAGANQQELVVTMSCKHDGRWRSIAPPDPDFTFICPGCAEDYANAFRDKYLDKTLTAGFRSRLDAARETYITECKKVIQEYLQS